MPDNSILGDKVNTEITEIALKLGWQPPEPKTPFDLLPLIIQASSASPILIREIPEKDHLFIPITHPQYREVFDRYKIKWYAIPALSHKILEIGGIEYTGCPFNGWYMSTEISGRNFTDPYRYDYKMQIATDLGLNTDSNLSLWFEKVQTILNEAVIYSYSQMKVSIVDQYTASESFMQHFKKETKVRGFCPADWVWLVPPVAGGMTEIFHQEMINFFILPGFKGRRYSL